MAALNSVQFDVQDEQGNLLGGATVTVRSEVDSSLVPLFTDRDGTISLVNPFTLAANVSHVAFFVAGGVYRIDYEKDAFVGEPRRYFARGTAGEYDIESLTGLAGAALLPSGDTTGETDRTNIEAAITAAIDAGQERVLLAGGDWYTDLLIELSYDNFCLEGSGDGNTIIHSKVSGDAGLAIRRSGGAPIRAGIRNLEVRIDNTGTGSMGIDVDRSWYTELTNVSIRATGGSAQIPFRCAALEGGGVALGIFTNVGIELSSGAADAIAVELTGTSTHDVNGCIFSNLNTQVNHASQTHLKLGPSDANVFIDPIQTSGVGGLLCTAIEFDFTINDTWPSQNFFYGYNPGYGQAQDANSYKITGTPSVFLTPNKVFGWGDGNGFSPPDNMGLVLEVDGLRRNQYSPVITGAVSNPTTTFTTRKGFISKQGRIVHVSVALNFATYSGGSGAVRISLPHEVTTRDTNYSAFGNLYGNINLSAGYTSKMVVADGGTSYVTIYEQGDNVAPQAMAVGALTTGVDYIFNITYETDAI